MAMSYTSLGKYTTAMARTRKALSIDPKYGLAYLTRGIIYETASDRCSDKRDGKISFDDKLVYQKAYNEYKKASGDIMWRSDAQKRMSYLAPLLPQNQDFFMHPDQKEPKDPCYEWIQ